MMMISLTPEVLNLFRLNILKNLCFDGKMAKILNYY